MSYLIYRLASLTPWLVTFLFGAAIFVVGKYLQKQERERARKRKVFSPGVSLPSVTIRGLQLQPMKRVGQVDIPQGQALVPHGKLGPYTGGAKKPQEPTVH